MNISDIREKLFSTKSKDRLRAAKEIGKQCLKELSEDILDAYKNEIRDTRTWQTQVALIESLGIIDNKEALSFVEPIVTENKEHDAITGAAAEAYVRLTRKSINDSKPVVELLRFGNYSVLNGCLNPLGYDRMMPNDDEIKELLRLCWNLNEKKERGLTDPRYGIAAACAGWKENLTQDFLHHCLATADKDTPLTYVSENSLKRKYVRLR